MSSTRAHTYASVATGLGALSRELHGGANAQVMEMLLGMGEVGNVRPWVARRLEEGERVIGMGHAVNKTDDPGAKFFAPMSERLGKWLGESKWYEMSRLIETATKEEFKPSIESRQ